MELCLGKHFRSDRFRLISLMVTRIFQNCPTNIINTQGKNRLISSVGEDIE